MKYRGRIKIFFFLLFAGIFGFTALNKEQLEPKNDVIKALETRENETIWFSREKLEPGDILILKIVNLEKLPLQGTFLSQEFNFAKLDKYWVSFLGIGVKEGPGKYYLKISFADGKFVIKEIEILEKKFRISQMIVTKELQEKGFEAKNIIKEIQEKEGQKINLICRGFVEKFYFKEPFDFPLEKINIVGDFGVLRKSKEGSFWHLGVDLDAKVGTPVFAINNGKVVLAEEFQNFGKTLIIDHGGGIFSLYLHLSEFKVKEGDFVEKKQIVALSGNTGYSLEPHLHFSIRVNGISVEPLKFIETLNKDLFKEN